VSKPPPTTPHSDLDGVHRDEKPNVESAIEAGEDSGDVARAKEQSTARPKTSGDIDEGEKPSG
jgi:hypothetical protein